MEKDEKEQSKLMFAGIALPGLIAKASMFETPQEIAVKAFKMADAMIEEMERRILGQSDDNED